MRVVAGSARGRRLVAPPGQDVRPTSDRVREAVFNALGSLGAVRGSRVLDLFAGSGALGIEALSRGAAHATFVERDPRALRALEDNLTSTGLADRATVVRGDALDRLDRVPGGVDLVLADPPYAFSGWGELLERLARRHSAAVVVVESDRDVEPPDGGAVVRRRRYGGTVVTILTLTRGSRPGAPGRTAADPTTSEDPT